MKWLSAIAVVLVAVQVRLPFRLAPPSNESSVLTSADIQYVGAENVDNSSTRVGQAYYGAGQLTGYRSGGVLHFVLLGNQSNVGFYTSPNTTVTAGASTTVFTVADASSFAVNDKLHVCRFARSGGSHTDSCEEVVPENTKITNIATNVLTVSPALGGTPAANDYVYTEHIGPLLDVTDQGTWNADPASATTAPQSHYYDDPYNGRRGWWEGSNNEWFTGSGFITTFGLYYHNGLYYMTNFRSYADLNGLMNLIIFDPVNDITYGPFITSATDGDGVTKTGNLRCEVLFADPNDSTKFGCGGFLAGGEAQMPWGPNGWVGHAWPTSSTTGGYGSPALDFGTTRLLTYYFMADSGMSYHTTLTGSYVGGLRSWRYPAAFPYIYEGQVLTYNGTLPNMVDPDQNAGVGSWEDTDLWGGYLRYRGTYKRGDIFVGNLSGRTGGNNADCTTGQHMWYASGGNAYFTLSNPNPNVSTVFDTDVNLIGNTSGASLRLEIYTYSNGFSTGQLNNATDFTVGETVHGNVSGHTATVAAYHNQLYCLHNCDATNGFGTTGPSVSHKPKTGYFMVYDPDVLDEVRAGSTTDYTVDPTSVIDLMATYTYPQSGYNDSQAYMTGFLQDPDDPTYFYTLGNMSANGTPPQPAIIYKWHINDSPAPAPAHAPFSLLGELGMVCLLSLAGWARLTRKVS